MSDVTNPGLVNVADQGDGIVAADQSVTVGPAQIVNPNLVNVVNQGDGLVAADQAVTVGSTQVAGTTVQAGAYSPQSPDTTSTTQNNVAGQTYGEGDPSSVYV